MPAEQLRGDDEEDTALLLAMLEEASRYLASFDWCSTIRRRWFGFGVGGVAAVFLFEIVPSREEVDSLLWVVVGDLPPAYLVVDEIRTPQDALRSYVEEMRGWIEAVRTAGSLDEVIPVNVTPTNDHADELENRLGFLEKELLEPRTQ